MPIKSSITTPSSSDKLMSVRNLYRPNVAMAIIQKGRLLLLERINSPDNWQLPQGGVDENETIEVAMWRELKEETGISPKMASIRARTKQELFYTIPLKYRRKGSRYKGQRQHWFLLELQASDKNINLDGVVEQEFSNWRWSGYWSAIHHAIDFKKNIYREALLELLPHALKLGV